MARFRAHSDTRAFSWRVGVRIQGTVVACDASAGSDLIFLSSAFGSHSLGSHSLGARGDARSGAALPRARGGKRQILTTDVTLTLLGPAGQRLRPHALLATHGRPFSLGNLRLELFASGYGPGAASLLCERDGRRVVYTGPLGRARATTSARDRDLAGADAEVDADVDLGPGIRPAHALCLDARFGAPRFRFPEPAEALATLLALVRHTLGQHRAPVILLETAVSALATARALVAAGVAVRAHRAIVQAAMAHRAAGLEAPPLQRFDGRVRPGEALLWPSEGRWAPRLGALEAPVFVLASGWAADPEAIARTAASAGVALSHGADQADLLRYIESSGATEVALLNAPDDEFAALLRARGLDAYALGPPRQIQLFSPAA